MERLLITSRQNPNLSALCKLDSRKGRDSACRFRMDGWKLVREAVARGVKIECVFVRRDVEAEWDELCRKDPAYDRIPVYLVEPGLFDRISDEKAPEGVIARACYIDNFSKSTIIDEDSFQKVLRDTNRGILFLDAVQNPENLGALIRSAAAFGVRDVVCGPDCADFYHPKLLRASMGTVFDRNLYAVQDLPGAIRARTRLGGRVFAAVPAGNAQTLGRMRTLKGDSVVIGNEGHGLSADVRDACTSGLTIPMDPGAESLNAAVAGGILLWELWGRGVGEESDKRQD